MELDGILRAPKRKLGENTVYVCFFSVYCNTESMVLSMDHVTCDGIIRISNKYLFYN